MDNSPSTAYHSPQVLKFNQDARASHLQIDLSEAALIAAARQETGLERFGDESFLPAMRAMLNAVETEAQLNPFGRATARNRTLRSLKNRLWANACFEAHPEIQRRKIVAPLIIIGPHRSGTTRIQRMLASDARLQHLKAWEGINPAPRPGWPDLGREARQAEARKMLDDGLRINPEARIAHPMDADWPEEDAQLLNHSFCGMANLSLYNVTDYYPWFLAADKGPGYRYLAEQMKLISWARGNPEDQPWMLKNPQHMLNLDVLMQTFPDAKLVFTHRDPLKTVGSVMSLMWLYGVQNTDLPCRAHIREVWLDLCERMVRRCMEVRETIPAGQQIDVYYEDMNRDWRAVVGKIYQFAGLELTPAAEHGMEAWLAESEREGRHTGHRYALEDFGTNREEVDARMRFYRERFNIPYENKKS
ncbi:MAG: sulfotransferase [Sulfuricella sp.]|nr:sulfotransferase [Sulfuricella sp.]